MNRGGFSSDKAGRTDLVLVAQTGFPAASGIRSGSQRAARLGGRQAMVLALATWLIACQQETAGRDPTYDLSRFADCAVMDAMDEQLASEGCLLRDEAGEQALLVTRRANTVSVLVVADGEPGQLIEETVAEGQAPPWLEDVNGDGRSDLFISRETGNVNTATAIWLAGEGGRAYARLGEIAGFGHRLTAQGLLAVPARSSAAAVEVAFYRIEPSALTEVAVVTVTGEPGPTGTLVQTCTLTRRSEGEAQTDRQMQDTLCAEPEAMGAFE